MEKFELTEETKKIGSQNTLYRIKYLIDIPSKGVKAGDLGGFLQTKFNLSQDGTSVVLDEAVVMKDAYVDDDSTVSGYAMARGSAYIADNAKITGYAVIENASSLIGNSEVGDHVRVSGDSVIEFESTLKGDVVISSSKISDSTIEGKVSVRDSKVFHIVASDKVLIKDSKIRGFKHSKAKISGNAEIIKSSLREVTELVIMDNSKLWNVYMNESVGVMIQESSLLHSTHNSIMITGESILFSNSCEVIATISGSPKFTGKNISVKDFATITGGFSIDDDVQISDFASLVNEQTKRINLKQEAIYGDSQLIF